MEELPIYSDVLRRGLSPFQDLENLEGVDFSESWKRFDSMIDFGEGTSNVKFARESLTVTTKEVLLKLHEALYPGMKAAGSLRLSLVAALFKGQDCPAPEFIGRSLQNLEEWLRADSIIEMHPIEKAALTITRLIDIWPFNIGNRTTAVVFSNHFLAQANLPPFFILPDELKEFDKILEKAIIMQTQPLVTVIHKSMQRELNLVGR